MALRLAVDARVVAEDTRGIGRYARAVLRRLIQRDDLTLTLLAPGLFPQRMRSAYQRALGADTFRVAARAGGAEVVWHPANGTVVTTRAPSVATIHDAVPFRFPAEDPRRGARDRAPFLRSARSATRVIAVSEFGRRELEAVLGIAPERIVVIHHGVERSFSPGTPQALPAGLRAGEYFLFVGDPQSEPRKNFAALQRAHAAAWPRGDGPPLVVAGRNVPTLAGVIAAGNLGDDLEIGAAQPLRDLYRGALALTLPSLHETFGMPMLEAMACGTPVLAARTSCLPEVGGDAARYVDAEDGSAWRTALREIAGDAALRERLRQAGLARAAQFDWDASARAHFELLRAVAR